MKSYMKPELQVREIRILENIAATPASKAYAKISGKIVPKTVYSSLAEIDSASTGE